MNTPPDASNGRASAYGQQYAYHTAPVKDSAQPLPYKNAPPVTPLRIVKPSEFKSNGFYVENLNSPLSPDDDPYTNAGPAFETNHHQIPLPQVGPSVNHHSIHPYPEQWSSAGESSQRLPAFDSYGAMSSPASQYPPQTPRRPLPPRPSQQQHQAQVATHPPMSPHHSQPSHLSFDPSTAYARSAAHSSAYSGSHTNPPYNPLSLYKYVLGLSNSAPKLTSSDQLRSVCSADSAQEKSK